MFYIQSSSYNSLQCGSVIRTHVNQLDLLLLNGKFIIAVYIDSYVMMSSDLYGTCSYCFYGTCPIVSWRSAHQRRIARSLSDVGVICLDTLLYIDGIFTVHVIPFICLCIKEYYSDFFLTLV